MLTVWAVAGIREIIAGDDLETIIGDAIDAGSRCSRATLSP